MKIIIIAEFILVAYLLYSLTANIFRSYRIDVHIKNFEEENQLIEEENRKKSDDYMYYTSLEYIDKIAKQNLGLINPGEDVIVLPPQDSISELAEEEGYSSELAELQRLSNPKKWWKFFFGTNWFKS